jgi:hypothetical protein
MGNVVWDVGVGASWTWELLMILCLAASENIEIREEQNCENEM